MLKRRLPSSVNSRRSFIPNNWRLASVGAAFYVQSLRFRLPETIVVGGFQQRQKIQRRRARRLASG